MRIPKKNILLFKEFQDKNTKLNTSKSTNPVLCSQVLCTPASSTTSERIFSTSEKILETRRTILNPSNLGKMLFLHEYEEN